MVERSGLLDVEAVLFSLTPVPVWAWAPAFITGCLTWCCSTAWCLRAGLVLRTPLGDNARFLSASAAVLETGELALTGLRGERAELVAAASVAVFLKR